MAGANHEGISGITWPGHVEEQLRRKAPSRLLRVWFPWIFALHYAVVLAGLPVDVFKDRGNYLIYASYSDLILDRYASGGLLTILANEPLWLILNTELAKFLSPESIVRSIVFVPAFLVSYLLLRSNPRNALWLVLFLLIPQVIKNHIIHLRQGVALSIFMLGASIDRKWIRLALMTASAFIHSSFFFVVTIYIIVWIVKSFKLSFKLQIIVYICGFITLATFIDAISSTLGARQAREYGTEVFSISGFGFLFWLSILIIYISSRREFVERNLFSIASIVTYISMYFIAPISGRVFESTILFVLNSGLQLAGWKRQAFLGMIILYTILAYALRLEQPWLGWGYIGSV